MTLKKRYIKTTLLKIKTYWLISNQITGYIKVKSNFWNQTIACRQIILIWTVDCFLISIEVIISYILRIVLIFSYFAYIKLIFWDYLRLNLQFEVCKLLAQQVFLYFYQSHQFYSRNRTESTIRKLTCRPKYFWFQSIHLLSLKKFNQDKT